MVCLVCLYVPSINYQTQFFVRPYAILNDQWGNIMHKGPVDYQRNPAVWFYPSDLFMHVRSGSPSNWNNGCDITTRFKINQWTHVAFTHDYVGLKV